LLALAGRPSTETKSKSFVHRLRRFHRDERIQDAERDVPPEERPKLLVYLGGPIEYATDEQQHNWRAEATAALEAAGHAVINPCGKAGWDDHEIVEQDLRDLQRADILLAWVPKDVPMMGTPMEIFYFSRILGKPAVTWGRDDSNPWLWAHTENEWEKLSDALLYIEQWGPHLVFR